MNSTPNPFLFRFIVFLCCLSIASLVGLHFLSPEFDPSWRMISEYAYGSHGWLLQLFFFWWAAASVLLAIGILPLAGSIWAKVGVFFLVLSGAGELMGALFDIRHPLHGAAFGLGVPTVPVAALLIAYYTVKQYPVNRSLMLWASHSTWISLIIMAVSMMVYISGLQKAGLFHPETGQVPDHIPDDVVAIIGYANRLLVGCYIGWLIVVSVQMQKVKAGPEAPPRS